jgi:hypothetical protein
MMYNTVPILKPILIDPPYEPLQVPGYDKAIFPVFNRLFDMFRDLDQLFRAGATDKELKNLPPMNYGKEESKGVFRIAMNCLGKLKKNYESAIKVENLKSCTSMEQFLKIVKGYNTEMANFSIQLQTINDRNTASPKDLEEYDEIQASRNVAKIQRRFRETQERGRNAEVKIMKALYKIVGKIESEDDEGDDLLASDETDFAIDVENSLQKKNPEKRLFGVEVKKKSVAKSYGACITYFKTGKCEKSNCPWSHEEEAMLEFEEEIKKSPWRGKSRDKTNQPVKRIYKLGVETEDDLQDSELENA